MLRDGTKAGGSIVTDLGPHFYCSENSHAKPVEGLERTYRCLGCAEIAYYPVERAASSCNLLRDSAMAPSAKEDRFLVIGILKAPEGLSKKEFDTRVEALVDGILSVPVAHQNVHKVELMFQNPSMDEHLKKFELPASPPMVTIVVETEISIVDYAKSKDHLLAPINDTEIRELFAPAAGLGFHRIASFSAEVSTLVDSDSPPTQHTHRAAGFFKLPPQLSVAQWKQQTAALVDELSALPALHKFWTKFQVWWQNTEFHPHSESLGLTPPEPTVILYGESETVEHMADFSKDPGIIKVISNANNDFGLNIEAHCGSVDVVTKVYADVTWFTDGSLLAGLAGGAAVLVVDGGVRERILLPLGEGQVVECEIEGLLLIRGGVPVHVIVSPPLVRTFAPPFPPCISTRTLYMHVCCTGGAVRRAPHGAGGQGRMEGPGDGEERGDVVWPEHGGGGVEAFPACGLGVSVTTDGTLYQIARIRLEEGQGVEKVEVTAYFILTLATFAPQSLFVCSPPSQRLQYPGHPLLHHTGTTRTSDARSPPKLHMRVAAPRAPNPTKGTASPAVVRPELVYAWGGSMSPDGNTGTSVSVSVVSQLGHQTVRNTPTGVKITGVFGLRDGLTRFVKPSLEQVGAASGGFGYFRHAPCSMPRAFETEESRETTAESCAI
ncbi:hypothetical protein DFH08DRAFT_942004 [Mycena albidolilacea]|uniref:Uncharacterized protein n=1 Tax=Mycena albidolilacea TaxID=1033008 RepID=A0AAD7EFI3_9AGAR|nr:hypothetical protein DFH08DRAFT_942004 [Mycena albidolilacea]